MNILKSEGIIINKLNLRDADRFLTIFTGDHGKIVCYARGVRNITSTRLSKLNLFSHIAFEVIEKGGRKTLTHVDLVQSHRKNKSNLKNIKKLFQIGELIDALVPESEANEPTYELLTTALNNLHRFDTPEYLRRFKIKLLKELGYGTHDTDEENIDRFIESILEKPLMAGSIL